MYVQNHLYHHLGKTSSKSTPSSQDTFAAVFQQKQQLIDSTKNDSNYLDTNQGQIAMNLTEYYSPKTAPVNLLDVPLLLPTENNVSALSEHASSQLQQLLNRYQIPTAPKQINYDEQGQIQLPSDYPYSETLKQALEENPDVARPLRDLHAIAGHYAAIKERMPFIEAMQQASSQAEANQIIARYSHFFNDNPEYKDIVLNFSPQGELTSLGL